MYLLLMVAHGVAAPSCRSNSHPRVVHICVLIPAAVGVVPGVIVLVGDLARNTFKQELDLQSGAPFSHSSRAVPSAKFEYQCDSSARDYAENPPKKICFICMSIRLFVLPCRAAIFFHRVLCASHFVFCAVGH